jgi:hypothetical protein
MRPSIYYYNAGFFLHGDPAEPCIDHAYRRSTQCFRDAAALFTPAIEVVEIPHEDTVLHGYFYRAANGGGDGTARPVMVLHNGFDGTAEEMHANGAVADLNAATTFSPSTGRAIPPLATSTASSSGLIGTTS